MFNIRGFVVGYEDGLRRPDSACARIAKPRSEPLAFLFEMHRESAL